VLLARSRAGAIRLPLEKDFRLALPLGLRLKSVNAARAMRSGLPSCDVIIAESNKKQIVLRFPDRSRLGHECFARQRLTREIPISKRTNE
jgi:hypothetical protein